MSPYSINKKNKISVSGFASQSSVNDYDTKAAKGRRIGVIGLDTSHAPVFSEPFNLKNASPDLLGYKVVAAYPWGSREIEFSRSRIPRFTEDVRKMGIEIVDSISDLLKKTDVILLLTNDGQVHLEQALQVFKAGKRVFIDKPFVAALPDAFAIFQAAKELKVPTFSSSSARYCPSLMEIANNRNIDQVMGATSFNPCTLEKTHSDFFWYGIHGVEMLYTLLGTGCQSVSRTHTQRTDFSVGLWKDNRIGTYRGTRDGEFTSGGIAFCQKEIRRWDGFDNLEPFLKTVAGFFQSGIPPVAHEETLEIYTFMEAADESKRQGGASISLEETKQKALAQVKKVW